MVSVLWIACLQNKPRITNFCKSNLALNNSSLTKQAPFSSAIRTNSLQTAKMKGSCSGFCPSKDSSSTVFAMHENLERSLNCQKIDPEHGLHNAEALGFV